MFLNVNKHFILDSKPLAVVSFQASLAGRGTTTAEGQQIACA